MISIFLIGGTMGVGKTTTCQVIKGKLNNSIFQGMETGAGICIPFK